MDPQAQLHEQLEASGWWRPLAEYDDLLIQQPDEEPPKVKPTKQLTPYAWKRQPAYKRGRRAFLDGWSRTKNPYIEETLSHEIWLAGWKAAKEKGNQT